MWSSIGNYLFAFVDTGKVFHNSHVSAQPLPIFQLCLIAEASLELSDDGLSV